MLLIRWTQWNQIKTRICLKHVYFSAVVFTYRMKSFRCIPIHVSSLKRAKAMCEITFNFLRLCIKWKQALQQIIRASNRTPFYHSFLPMYCCSPQSYRISLKSAIFISEDNLMFLEFNLFIWTQLHLKFTKVTFGQTITSWNIASCFTSNCISSLPPFLVHWPSSTTDVLSLLIAIFIYFHLAFFFFWVYVLYLNLMWNLPKPCSKLSSLCWNSTQPRQNLKITNVYFHVPSVLLPSNFSHLHIFCYISVVTSVTHLVINSIFLALAVHVQFISCLWLIMNYTISYLLIV